MTKEQRDHLERRLLRERDRALRALKIFDERRDAGDGDLTTYPFHMADEGTDTIEQEKDFLLASKEGRIVFAIDEALRTLYRTPEQYGLCAECGNEIMFERLDLVPWAHFCVDCQRSSELRVQEEAA